MEQTKHVKRHKKRNGIRTLVYYEEIKAQFLTHCVPTDHTFTTNNNAGGTSFFFLMHSCEHSSTTVSALKTRCTTRASSNGPQTKSKLAMSRASNGSARPSPRPCDPLLSFPHEPLLVQSWWTLQSRLLCTPSVSLDSFVSCPHVLTILSSLSSTLLSLLFEARAHCWSGGLLSLSLSLSLWSH